MPPLKKRTNNNNYETIEIQRDYIAKITLLNHKSSSLQHIESYVKLKPVFDYKIVLGMAGDSEMFFKWIRSSLIIFLKIASAAFDICFLFRIPTFQKRYE